MARLISIVTIIGISLLSVFTAEELYSDKYDYIDGKSILANDRLREEYYGCFIDRSPCRTADQRFFHDIISEAVVTNCKKCTEKQKETLDAITDWYTQNQPDKWNEIVAKSLENLKKKYGGQ